MTRLLSILIVTSIVAAYPPAAWGCPFCPPSFRNTILQELETTSVAVLAELVRPPRENDEGTIATGYRVTAVLRGRDRLTVGDVIDLPLRIPSPVGSVHMLLAEPGTDDGWRRPRGLSPAARQFLRQAASLPTVENARDKDNQLRRLSFALNFLDSNDPAISQAVYAEFAAAPYSTVKELSRMLNPNKLRALIELEQGAASDRRLLFTLLAICGRPNDAEFVKAALDNRVDREQFAELDGVIAAYLTLTGEDGLDQLDRELLEPNEVAPAIRRAAQNALRFHAEHESIFNKRRIISSTRLLLDDPKSADYAIRDLTSWQDWESLGAIVALWNEHAGQCRWLRAPIREYLEACPLPAARSALASTQRTTPSKDLAPCKN